MASPNKPDQMSTRPAWWLRPRTGSEWLPADWLPRTAVAALSLLIVAEAAHISWSLWTLGRTPAAPRTAAPRTVAALPQPAIAELVAAHLFGKAPDAPAPDAPAATAAQWVLTGTLQGSSPATGAAILGRTVSATRFHTAGEELAGGFRLVEVFADRVTLERAGERLSLTLPRAIHGSFAPQGVSLAAAAVIPEARSREERLRERPQNQTPALRELRPSLHRGPGRFDGMRVWGTGDGSNLATYGLRRNDIIREVDGEAIDNGEAQRRALDTLSRGHPVAVTVERSGNVFTLQLGITDTGS
jgi:type II secretory pathway component PulC